MELKKGYKQTECGILPEDWQLTGLPNLCWFQEGPGLRNWQFTSSGMKIINVTNLEGGVLNLDRTDRHISISLFNRMYRHFAIDASDIVMASSGNSYSKTAVVREQDLPLVMNTSVIRFKPSRLCNFGYLWALLRSPKFKEQIDLMITGGAQPNFGPYHLKRMVFPLPTLVEQEAIAEALSDADAWIESLEQLIAKKRQIKQGAMQELLTGKRRLPGFSGEWEVKQLCDEIDLLTGFPFPSQGYSTIGIRLLRGSNIKRGVTDWSEDITQYWSDMSAGLKEYVLREGDIVVAMDGSLVGRSFAQLSAKDLPALLLQRVARIRSSTIDMGYLKEHVCSDSFTSHCDSVKTVTAIPHISPKDIRDFKLPLPPSKEEQAAISSVLSEMSENLMRLESKLAKARQIKRAMMQELLTGRIRLVEPSANTISMREAVNA